MYRLSRSPVVPPGLSCCKCGATPSSICHLAQSSCCRLALHLGCLSLPLLPVWMNVSSLSPWLWDFHTVWFSGSSGWFLFLNLVLFFWLFEEAQCIYLCLHLGQKYIITFFNPHSRTCLLISERERNIDWLTLTQALTGDLPMT